VSDEDVPVRSRPGARKRGFHYYFLTGVKSEDYI
jgi:hypothetical protein